MKLLFDYLSREQKLKVRDELKDRYWYTQRDFLENISEDDLPYAQGQFDMISEIIEDIDNSF